MEKDLNEKRMNDISGALSMRNSTDGANPTVSHDTNQAGRTGTCLLDTLDIAVTDTERRFNSGLKASVSLTEGYNVYLIETKLKPNLPEERERPETLNNFGSLWRRYSEFEALRMYLQTRYPFVVMPPLPEKRPLFAWQMMVVNTVTAPPMDSFQPDFIDHRKAGLENFLLRVAANRTLCFNNVFIRFLQQEEVWNDSVAAVSYMGNADAKLKAFRSSYMIKKPDQRFEEVRNYSDDLSSNITNMLKVRSKSVNRQYGIFRLHANYARVFSNWSPIETELGGSLEKAANLMTAYSSLSECLYDEEQFVDQMKEYLFYAESLKNVCRNHDLFHYEMEQAEETLNVKAMRQVNASQGKKNLISRIFTREETDDARMNRLLQMENQVHEAEDQCRQTSEDLRQFVAKASEEIDYFHRQKAKDLKESLILYAVLQIKMCKKGLAQWQSMRDCFNEM